jgi:hypothetical protein
LYAGLWNYRLRYGYSSTAFNIFSFSNRYPAYLARREFTSLILCFFANCTARSHYMVERVRGGANCTARARGGANYKGWGRRGKRRSERERYHTWFNSTQLSMASLTRLALRKASTASSHMPTEINFLAIFYY